jgi:hypothetical protein
MASTIREASEKNKGTQVKKKILFAMFVALAAGFISKAVLAFGTPSNGGVGAVMIAVIMDENKNSKSDSTKAPSISNLKDEFAALNNLPGSVKLIQQSAGGSADLKVLLN